MNWERALKCHLYRIKIFQNSFLKASLSRKNDCPIDVVCTTFGVLKLDGMIDKEYAEFFSDSLIIC